MNDNHQITQAEVSKWWEIFSGLNPTNGLLSGQQAAGVLKNSGLNDTKLEQVWDLADVDNDGSLDFEEFCVAMRLIFDLINGVYNDVPLRLPDFLIPSSKAHFITASQAISGQSVSSDQTGNDDDDDDFDDEGSHLSDNFEWYISPSDRRTYETIHSSHAGRHGQIIFSSLEEFFGSLNIPDTDIRSAWNLVNPHAEDSISKDQAVILFHILNQRHQGVRVPKRVPPSLRSTFDKKQPSYEVSTEPPAPQKRPPTHTTKKSAFAESYLDRLGVGNRGRVTSGTDFSGSVDTDWEEVRLKKQLAELQKKNEETSTEQSKGSNRSKGSIALIRRELEKLLDYKRSELRKLENGEYDADAVNVFGSVRNDIDDVRGQFETMQNHQHEREKELARLRQEIDQVKTT